MFGLNFLWLVFLLHDMRIIFNPHSKVLEIINPAANVSDYRQSRQTIIDIYEITLQGFILISALIYLTDNYYRFIFKTKFQTYFGIIKKNSKGDEELEV